MSLTYPHSEIATEDAVWKCKNTQSSVFAVRTGFDEIGTYI